MNAKHRSRTLIEQLGFNDPDLLSPTHDGMVLWIAEHIFDYVKAPDPLKDIEQCIRNLREAVDCQLRADRKDVEKYQDILERKNRYNQQPKKICDYIGYDGKEHYRDETPEEITRRLAKIPESWEENLLNEALQKQQITQSYVGMEFPVPAIPSPQITTTFEYAVTTDRKFIVGFVDVFVQVQFPLVNTEGINWNYDSNGKPLCAGLSGNPKLCIRWTPQERLLFEAKPTIRSLGELMRQIRTYQEYEQGRFIVVSPDTRFRENIESQGIEFWDARSFVAPLG